MRCSVTENVFGKEKYPPFGYNHFSVLFNKVSVYVKIKHVKIVEVFKVEKSDKQQEISKQTRKNNKIRAHGLHGDCRVRPYLKAS